MGKALVLKNVDFTTNALATIMFDDVPCTGISLDKATASIVNVGNNTTLTAAVTPADTTDSITWTTSNSAVATVVNGVVTSVSAGTATITAMCGEHSATCVVTVAIEMAFLKGGSLQWPYSAIRDNVTVGTSLSNKLHIAFGCTENIRNACKYEDYINIYPYPIPTGAKTITVTSQDLASLIVYYDINEAQTNSQDANYANCAKVLDGETLQGGYSNTISAWTYDERTYVIPDNPNIDSFTLTFHPKNDSAFDAFDPTNSGVTVTFGFDDPE